VAGASAIGRALRSVKRARPPPSYLCAVNPVETAMSEAVPRIRHDDIFVGFKPIDDLHREFQNIVDALVDPAEADYGEHLLALHEHMLRHTALEEQYMLQENYPHYGVHKREHDRFVERLADMRRRFDAGDTESVRHYANELMGWFAAHAQNHDAALAAYLKGEAGAR
jgi:hemerythrin-like metal-binding protein